MFKTEFITVQNYQLFNYGEMFSVDLCIICTLLNAVG